MFKYLEKKFFGLNTFAINHYLRRNRCGSSGIFFIFTVKVSGVTIVVLHHASPFKSFKCFCNNISIINKCFINILFWYVLTWINHGLLYGLWILPWPLLHFLIHFLYLFLVHGPQAAFPLVGSICWWFFNFFKAFI